MRSFVLVYNLDDTRPVMTSEERLDRIEHLTAGLAEQVRKDREESRQLWRSTQEQLDLLVREVRENARQLHELQFELRDGFRTMQAEAKARDQVTNERINALVSAIGGLLPDKKQVHP